MITWTTVSCDHCRRAWLELLAVAPGTMLLTAASLATPSRSLGVPPTLMPVAAGAVSLALVVAAAWLAAAAGRARGLVLAAVAAGSSALAWGAYHLVRM